VAPTLLDPETRSLVAANGRDLESSALLSPSIQGRRDSILSAASEPPDFSAEEAEDLLNRGSISGKMIKNIFKGDRASSRSPSRSRSPAKRRPDIVNSRSQSYQSVDGDRDRNKP
jgi:hypothetical protein